MHASQPPAPPNSLSQDLYVLSREAREFYLPTRVPELEESPSPLVFYRDYVAKNIPVIIRGGIKHWKAYKDWEPDYLVATVGPDTVVTVDATPTGRADDIMGEYFVQPEVRPMSFKSVMDHFVAIHEGQQEVDILYVQKQDDNLSKEFSVLFGDIERGIPWVTEALGLEPDVYNIWMGTDSSITSMHRDPYENMYGVVRGEKTFTLLPPFDYHMLYEASYKAARWTKVTEAGEEPEWRIREDTPPTQTQWISVDPNFPDAARFPRAARLQPLRAVVAAGDLLYLPALWYHEVRQQCLESPCTIAVNFWYDMAFDVKFVYDTFVRAQVEATLREQIDAAARAYKAVDYAIDPAPLGGGGGGADGGGKGKGKGKGPEEGQSEGEDEEDSDEVMRREGY